MGMWTVKTRDQTAPYVQSDLDLPCPERVNISVSLNCIK